MKHIYYLEVDNSAVLKETLKYYPGKQPAEIFSRETINGITHIRLGSKVKLNVAEQEKLQVNTLSNMSVVSAYATANFMVAYTLAPNGFENMDNRRNGSREGE